MKPRSHSAASLLAVVATGLAFGGAGAGLGAPLHAQDQVVRGASTMETSADETAAPIRIALQAGHWLSAEVPDELARLRTNGTRGGGREEWEVTLDIAQRTAVLLEARGYEVEVLPATVPQGYRADLFIAIHADGFHSPSASGFSVASPRRDATGRAGEFADVLASSYREVTQMRHRVATRRMRGYYAFNTRRYRHSVHPSTVGVIIETGFLTSPVDRQILLGDPGRSALGIAQAVERFLPLPVADEDAGLAAGAGAEGG